MDANAAKHMDANGVLFLQCPYCLGTVEVKETEINCSIFRHGIFKHNGEQIPPHSPKQDCDRYIAEDSIYGCGGPFRLVKTNQCWTAEVCDYI
jgi:hypothetical protein